MTVHCLIDDCTDDRSCPCPCEECFFARQQAGTLRNTMTTQKHLYLRHHPRMRGVRLATAANFPAGTLSPAQILTAYGFKQNQYAGAAPVKLGIGSLGGGVVQKDIDNSVAAWGMLAPNLTVRTVAGGSNDPSDQDSNVENMLDIVPTMAFTWWWLTGTAADVTICVRPERFGRYDGGHERPRRRWLRGRAAGRGARPLPAGSRANARPSPRVCRRRRQRRLLLRRLRRQLGRRRDLGAERGLPVLGPERVGGRGHESLRQRGRDARRRGRVG